MAKLENIKEQNRHHLFYGMCTGIFVFLGLIIALVVSIKKPIVQDSGEVVSLIIRFGAAIAFYWQSDYYRRKVLILLEEEGWAKLSTFFCGIVLASCVVAVLYEKSVWFVLFGVMMAVLAARNVIAYIGIRKYHAHPLRPIITRWAWAAVGYTFVIFLFSPLMFTLRRINSDIDLPVVGVSLGVWYIDVVPAAVLMVGMLVSIQRLEANLYHIEARCREHYEEVGS